MGPLPQSTKVSRGASLDTPCDTPKPLAAVAVGTDAGSFPTIGLEGARDIGHVRGGTVPRNPAESLRGCLAQHKHLLVTEV